MKQQGKIRSDLDVKFKKVLATPASFAFFVAIHDFVEHIESEPFLAKGLSDRIKINRELDVANKYAYLRKIYQGLEDINTESNADLGHARYAVMLELSRIQNNDVSDSNSFWKKRELSRKLASTIYERLNTYISVA